MNEERLRLRKNAIRETFFELSSDEEEIVKKPKLSDSPVHAEESQKQELPETEKKEASTKLTFGPTMKEDCKKVSSKLLESLGYRNRNSVPSTSTKKIGAPTLSAKEKVMQSLQKKHKTENEKISQLKLSIKDPYK